MTHDSSKDICITAWGVITALGVGESALWRGLLEGRSAIALHDPGDGGPALPAARVPAGVLPDGNDRTLGLLDIAAAQLVANPAWSGVDPEDLGVCLGTTQGCIETWELHQRRFLEGVPGRPPSPGLHAPGRHLAERLGAGGPLECPSLACASGIAAVGVALDWLRAGRCRAVVAGGVDAASAFVLRGFASLRALDPVRAHPFDAERAGLTAGEGAALVLLERGPVPGAPRLLGWGCSADANHLTGPDPTGSGVARAVRAALAMAGLEPGDVDLATAHGTGTVFNDLMEGKALEQVFGPGGGRLVVSAVKGALGHSMAAAGAIETLVAALALRDGLAPAVVGLRRQDPEIHLDLVQGSPRTGNYRTALCTSSGFGGFNAALVLGRS